ncbi:MAG: hypothetical protein JNG84_03340 [Archangium sp.]|nr:hypothetical protein [Archangium sp.]
MTALALALLLSAAPKVQATPPPVLVMVRTNGSAAFEKTQQRLHEELTLLLDSFMVILTSVDAKAFAKRPLAEQLSIALPLSKANDAVAVVWLAEPLPGQVMLHLVAMGTGRTLVRTLEFDRRSQSEEVLAVMLRELLGTAFLYEPAPQLPPTVRALVSTVRTMMPPLETLASSEPAARPLPTAPTCGWCLQVTAGAVLEAGLGEALGPSSRGGASATASVLASLFRVGVALDVVSMSAKVSSTERLSATSTALLLTGAWRWRRPTVALGPVVALGLEPTWSSLQGATRFTIGPVALLGAEVLVPVGPVSVWVRAALHGRTRLPQLIENTSGNLVWQLASVSAQVTVGLGWEGF